MNLKIHLAIIVLVLLSESDFALSDEAAMLIQYVKFSAPIFHKLVQSLRSFTCTINESVGSTYPFFTSVSVIYFPGC